MIPTLQGRVLEVLARVDTGMTGRAVWRNVGVDEASWSGVRRALGRAVDHGLVTRVDHGPAGEFRLNRDHLAADTIVALANLRTSLWADLESLAGDITPAPEWAMVFGSTARGDGDALSDIDVMFVRPKDVTPDHEDWTMSLARFETSCEALTGNQCRIVDLSPGDVRRLRESGDELIAEIGRDGVTILGASPIRIGPAESS